MTFAEYWEAKGHLGGDPEEVAMLAWNAAVEACAKAVASERERHFSTEREACAKIADHFQTCGREDWVCERIAEQIRARGKA